MEFNTPNKWKKKPLGEIFEFHYGKALPEKVRSGQDYPVYGSNGIVGYHAESSTDGGTIIIGRKGSIGEVNYSSGPCFPIDTTYYIDQFYGMSEKYWYYWLKYANLGQLNRATAIPGLNREDAYKKMAAVPPLEEQKRIADKLDMLLARVDACREHLDRVPNIIKQFRQAVLSAAVTGKLTEEWRGINNFGDDKYQGKGLSSSWKLSSFDDVLTLIDGDRGPNYPKQSDYQTSGYCLFLSTKNVREFGFQFDDVTFISEKKHKTLRSGTVQTGDVVLTTRGTLGNVAYYDESIPYKVVRINSGMLILRKKSDQLLGKYLLIFLASPYFAYQLDEKRSGSAQPQIPARILRTFTLPIPPENEQVEIIRRVNILFAFADRLDARYQSARKKVDDLTPALLDKAFRGDLVPQDPNDEPASVLLERIQIEREAARKNAGQNRKPPKKKTGSKVEGVMRKLSEITPTHLSNILKENGSMLPERLWAASELEIEDFYDQLKDEELKGFLKEIRNINNDLVVMLEAL